MSSGGKRTTTVGSGTSTTSKVRTTMYGYPGAKTKQQRAARKLRIAELRRQVANYQSMIRVWHLLMFQAEAELAAVEAQDAEKPTVSTP